MRRDAARWLSVDDAVMGWSRYAQSMALDHLSPHVLYLAPTLEASRLAAQVALRLAAADDDDEAFVLTDEAGRQVYVYAVVFETEAASEPSALCLLSHLRCPTPFRGLLLRLLAPPR